MLTFDDPGYLLLLVFITPVVYLVHFWKGRGGVLGFPLSFWGGPSFKVRLPGTSLLRFFTSFLFWAAVLCVILTLSGPGLASRSRIHLNPGADIVLVFDESPSMAAQDFKPDNRFIAAQRVMEKFIRGRENDSIGLVSFAREAALRVPLTLDYPFLLNTLHQLKLGDQGDGTAIGMGLATAAHHLAHSTALQKVIVLLTDGVNNAGEIQPETAADILNTLDIRFYIIGIGTPNATTIDYMDPETKSYTLATIQNSFNESFLRGLAEKKGGVYYSATSPGSLESIFQSIDSRESGSKRVKVVVSTQLLYREFLLLALFFFLLSFFLRRLVLGEYL